MKKIFVIVSFLVCTVASAQVTKLKSGFGLSVRSGVSYFSNKYPNSGYNYISDKPAFIIGVSLFHEKQMSNNVIFRTQLSYLERGERSEWWQGTYIGSIRMGNSNLIDRYASVDMSLKQLFGKSKVRPYLQAGVRTDVYLNTKTKYMRLEDSQYSTSSYSTTGKNKYYHPINLSGFVGVGLSTKRWDVGLEYNSSFFRVNKQVAYNSGSGIQNFRTLNLQLSYRFCK